MVAVSDSGCGERERERMVLFAIESGWIQRACKRGESMGCSKSVAVLATDDARCPGPLGGIVEHAVKSLRHLRDIRRRQRDAGLRPYAVFALPLDGLKRMVDATTADWLQEAASGNEYAVLCMNGNNAALVSSVSRIATTEGST